MPAPLAKGIIFSISLLVAAGIAIYDSPQFREWIDESRRKIAIAIGAPGDESDQRFRYARASSQRSADVSMREDLSTDAEARRERARLEIQEKARKLDEKRRETTAWAKNKEDGRVGAPRPVRGASFDDLVDAEGRLKEKLSMSASTEKKKPDALAISTAVTGPEGGVLRNRNAPAGDNTTAQRAAVLANPFADEMGLDLNSSPLDEKEALIKQEAEENSRSEPEMQQLYHPQPRSPFSRETTVTLLGDAHLSETPTNMSDVNLKMEDDNGDAASQSSHHSSEQHIDLTPTTSRAPSVRTLSAPSSPVLSSSEYEDAAAHPQPLDQSAELLHHISREPTPTTSRSSTPSLVDRAASERDVMSMSEGDFGDGVMSERSMDDADDEDDLASSGIHTPSSWSEVGSVISGDEF